MFAKQMKHPRGTARRKRRENGFRKPEEFRIKEARERETFERALRPLRFIGSDQTGHYEMLMPNGNWESRSMKGL